MTDVVVGLQIHLFVFHTAPQALKKHIVQPTPLAIHADLNLLSLQHTGELLAGELATLIGVEDFWHTVFGDRVLQCIHTELTIQRVGQPPRKHSARVPVDYALLLTLLHTHEGFLFLRW